MLLFGIIILCINVLCIELLAWCRNCFRIEETNLEDGQTTISSDKFLDLLQEIDQSSMTDISKFYEEIHGQDQNLGDCWEDTVTTWEAKVKEIARNEAEAQAEYSGPTYDDPDYSKLIELQRKSVKEFDLASSG